MYVLNLHLTHKLQVPNLFLKLAFQPILSTVRILLLRSDQRAACQQTLLALTCPFIKIGLVVSTAILPF